MDRYANQKIYKAIFSPSDGLTVTNVRTINEELEFHERKHCTRVKDGKTYVYRLCDDPYKDAICIDFPEEEQKSMRLTPYGKACPYTMESSPFLYMTITDEHIHTLNTKTMEFLPALKIEGFDQVMSIIGIHNGEVFMETERDESRDTYLVAAPLPYGYYDASTAQFESEFLKKFKPLRYLGGGAFGDVFEVEHINDEWKYAVKRIALRGSEADVTKALKEARALASLKHEGIVGYNTSWIEKPPSGWQKREDIKILEKLGISGQPGYEDDCVFLYIQMELGKQTLQSVLSADKNRELARAKKWLKQLASAVGYIHQNNMIHRDLKPANILLDKDDRLKIGDFGIVGNRAIVNGREIDETKTRIGTPFYRAPEQEKGKYNSKVDVYSLGLILIELCVNMDPLKKLGVFSAIGDGDQTNILKHLPEAERLVRSMTNIEPAKRPTCEQILRDKFIA